MNKKISKRQQTEWNFASEKSRKKKVNAKKLARSVLLLLCIVAAILAAVYFLDAFAADPQPESTVAQSTPDGELDSMAGKLIVLDAGHGGFDVGAIGVSGAYEDDMNLKVAFFLKDDFEAAGARVIMTREDGEALADSKDADMQKRRSMIQNSESDIVVSIHMNTAEDSGVSGPLVLYMPGSVRGEALAKSIQASMIKQLAPDCQNCTRCEELYILQSGAQPCVIVECGFISNAEEEALLMTEAYQRKAARAIADGCADYFAKPAE
jgi:N-acetylmuramoyl-L-alanine amidase